MSTNILLTIIALLVGIVALSIRWAKVRSVDPELARKLLTAAIIFFGLLVFFLVIGGEDLVSERRHDYADPEELNRYSYEHYAPVSYSIRGDGVVLDACGAKATLTGIYQDDSYGSVSYKAEYLLENTSDQPLCLSFDCVCVNGRAVESGYDYFYDWLRPGDAVTVYGSLYSLADSSVSELVYTGMSVFDGDQYVYHSEDFLRISTDSPALPAPEILGGKLLYEGNGFRIINTGVDDYGYVLCIVNDTDNDFRASTANMKLDGEETYSTSGVYDSAIPAHSVFTSSSVYGYDREYNRIVDGGVLETSISFTCHADPSSDFSTGYFQLN